VDDSDTMNEAGAPTGLRGYTLRTVWVAVRLVLVYYLGQQGALFFYQAF
jgi:hypothetical protein